MECLSYGEKDKQASEFTKRNLCMGIAECKKCTAKRRGIEAVGHARAKAASYNARMAQQQIERKAKAAQEVEAAMVSRSPVKKQKCDPDIKEKIDNLLFDKELAKINSMYEL